MNDVKTDLVTLIDNTLQVNTSGHRQTIEKYYDTHAVINNPAFSVQGTENITKLFKAWSRWNTEMSNTIHNITYDNNTNKAVVDVTEHVRPKILPFRISLRMLVTFTLRDTDRGKVIVQQEEYLTLQGLIRCTAVSLFLYDHVVLPFFNALTHLGMSIMGQEEGAARATEEQGTSKKSE